MGFQVIEDLALADKLAEAGLLWFTVSYTTTPTVWRNPIKHPSELQGWYKDYTFFILLED